MALLCLDDFAVLQPTEVLDRRCIWRGGARVHRVLVRWNGLPATSVTWEDVGAMEHRFPGVLAWGQASSHGGRNVTTSTTTTQGWPNKPSPGVAQETDSAA